MGEGVGLGVRVGLAVNVLYVYVIDEQKIIDTRIMRHKWYWIFGKWHTKDKLTVQL